jgi:pyruvate,water dikinase
VPSVGGKNASLGELYSRLTTQGVKVPNALTAKTYRDALTAAGAWEPLNQLLDPIDKTRIKDLAKCAAKARTIVYQATDTPWLRRRRNRAAPDRHNYTGGRSSRQ